MAVCEAKPLEENAAWPTATAGTTVQGTCIIANGWQGYATRTCSSSAVWGPVTIPCVEIVPPCPSVVGYNSSTTWPATTANSIATGSCVVGRTPPPSGQPQRQCNADGTWNNTVINDCVVGTARGPAEQTARKRGRGASAASVSLRRAPPLSLPPWLTLSPGASPGILPRVRTGRFSPRALPATGGQGLSRISAVVIGTVTDTSVSLSWTASQADRYQILYTVDNGASFQVAPLPLGYSMSRAETKAAT